jgi:predicted alpha/beta-fold hydrolase
VRVCGKELDRYAVVAYNNFDNLRHYYSEMSALGDIPQQNYKDAHYKGGKFQKIAIPFCAVHALDDPLITWRTVADNDGFMKPENLVKSGSGNVMILLTKAGGHVGWPMGFFPFVEKWKWMSDVAMSFADAVNQAKRETKKIES